MFSLKLVSLTSYDNLAEVAGQYGTPLEFCDPRLLAIAEAERQFLDVEYDEYAASNVRGVAFFRSTTLIVSH